MLPSWFAKLRDVKAGSKYRQPHPSPSLISKKRDEHPAIFAKSLSLQRANSKARNARFEGGFANACSDKDDLCPSISDKYTQNVCNLQSSELGKDAAGPLSCARLSPWDGDCVSMSTCKSTLRLLPPGEETKASVEKGHGVLDNDTEDFTLTSETRSSFCSESSSADSSMACKCEEVLQDEQEGDNFEAFKSPDIVRKNSQKTCGEISGLLVSTEERSHYVEISPNLISRLCQENAHIRWSLMLDTRGQQSFLYSNLMTSRCSSVSEKGNADKASFVLKELKGGCSCMENLASVIKSKAGKANLDPRESKENCAFLKNLTNMQYNRSHNDNQEMSDKLHEKCTANAGVPNVDKQRHVSGRSENYGLDTLTQNAQHRERDEPHSSVESPSVIALSVQCTQHKSSEENVDGKQRAFSMRRRWQRGSSISAVLPPDLQGVVGDSLALVKMSDDPYEDFRQSMYEMIMEKDLEGSMDVEELLYCYLTLNSPEHHELIEEVFSNVWSAILMTLR